jgi:hypothetical protein
VAYDKAKGGIHMKRIRFIIFLTILIIAGYFSTAAEGKMAFEKDKNESHSQVNPLAP